MGHLPSSHFFVAHECDRSSIMPQISASSSAKVALLALGATNSPKLSNRYSLMKALLYLSLLIALALAQQECVTVTVARNQRHW
ncbi:MAG: hypothetical protein ICV54_04720 [Nostoc sp. C3-bin3]|nr:hypothetical protein [Nostoc sp. C3-bin3]